MSHIIALNAREILDSRGNPTVEVDALLSCGSFGRAAVPSGASTGVREALELRDGDAKRYVGKGVQKAVTAVNTALSPALVGHCALNQAKIDALLCEIDGTETKENCGANALLGVSLAVAKAAATHRGVALWQYVAELSGGTPSLPTPMLNLLNGGAHANNSLDIQEFMVMPIGAPTFAEGLRMGAEIFHTLKHILHTKGLSTAVGDEGGFAPNLKNGHTEALDLLSEATEKAGYTLGDDIVFALDSAASELYQNGVYVLKGENKKLTSDEMIAYYKTLRDAYPIASLEDGLAEEDWAGWQALTAELGATTQIVGDDIFVTNPAILARGITEKSANALLVKVNQIGTLTETLEAMAMAKKANFNCVMSHRSGETEDVTIADLAVGTGCGQIKTGAPSRSDRVAKYNQLLRIEEELGEKAVYAGGFTLHG